MWTSNIKFFWIIILYAYIEKMSVFRTYIAEVLRGKMSWHLPLTLKWFRKNLHRKTETNSRREGASTCDKVLTINVKSRSKACSVWCNILVTFLQALTFLRIKGWRKKWLSPHRTGGREKEKQHCFFKWTLLSILLDFWDVHSLIHV